jgi:hypothetical protein
VLAYRMRGTETKVQTAFQPSQGHS